MVVSKNVKCNLATVILVVSLWFIALCSSKVAVKVIVSVLSVRVYASVSVQ